MMVPDVGNLSLRPSSIGTVEQQSALHVNSTSIDADPEKRPRPPISAVGKWYPIFTNNTMIPNMWKRITKPTSIALKDKFVQAPIHPFMNNTKFRHQFVSKDGVYKMLCVDLDKLTDDQFHDEVDISNVYTPQQAQDNMNTLKVLFDELLYDIDNSSIEFKPTDFAYAMVYVLKTDGDQSKHPMYDSIVMLGYCMYDREVENNFMLGGLQKFCKEKCPIQNSYDYWQVCGSVRFAE